MAFGLPFLAGLCLICPQADAGCPDQWILGAALPDGSLLEAVVRGPDRWVAVGRDGMAAVSEDGLSWTPASLPDEAQGLAISHAFDSYVAVGYSEGNYVTSGVVMKSTDGFVWESAVIPATDWLGAIATDGATLVAVGGGGVVLTSNDGTTWIEAPTPTSEDLYGIAFGPGGFIAVGHSGTILSSSDGFVWHKEPSGTIAPLTEVATDDSIWVVAGGLALLRRTDGVPWTSVSTDVVTSALTFGAGRFIRVTGDGDVLISSDGVDWESTATLTLLTSGVSGDRESVVAVGDTTFISNDGRKWLSEAPTSFSCFPGDIVWAEGEFALTGCGVLTSRDGRLWSTTGRASEWNPTKIAWSGSRWVGVATSGGFDEWWGAIMTSDDGLGWETVESSYMKRYHDVVAGPDQFVIIGDEGPGPYTGGPFGFAMVSSDGNSWEVSEGGLPDNLNAIAYGRGVYVAVGQAGAVLTSLTGYGWEEVESPTAQDLFDVSFDGRSFIAVGTQGAVVVDDGMSSWQVQTTPVNAALYAVAAYRGCRVAAGRDGTIITNQDGAEWRVVPTGVTDTFSAVGAGRPGFVAAGEHVLRGCFNQPIPIPGEPPVVTVD